MRPLALGFAPLFVAIVGGACSIDFEGHFTGGDGDCAAESCVPLAPDGFQGPVAVVRGRACPEGSTEIASGTLCGACACVGTVGCGATQLELFGSACTDPPEAVAPVGSGECVDTNVSGGLLFARATARAPSPSCEPSGGGAEEVRLCSVESAAGCDEGSVCVPSDDGTVCVTRAGDWDCPADYPVETHLGGDGASCSACRCEAPTAACASSVEVFTAQGCTGTDASVVADGATCAPLSDAPQSVRATPPAPSDCQPEGGLPEGSPSATTVCCR